MQTLVNITTKELRDNLAEILEKVAYGRQIFSVSKFGKKKVILIPADPDITKTGKVDYAKLAAYGMWKDRKDIKDSASWVANLRKNQSKRSS